MATKTSKPKKPRAIRWPASSGQVVVPVDTAVYPLSVIQGAAYALTDRAFILLAPGEGSVVEVALTGREDLDEGGLRALGGEFANTLLDQALRATLDDSGRKIREYIVAKAHFFHDQGGSDVQSLLDATLLEAFDDDPLDIAVPWEEKYGDPKADP